MYEVQGTLTSPTPPPHPISSVATCNVVNDPRDLSSVAMDHVRSTSIATLLRSLGSFTIRYMLLRCWWGGVGGWGMLTYLVLRTWSIATLLRSLGSFTTLHVATLLMGWGGGVGDVNVPCTSYMIHCYAAEISGIVYYTLHVATLLMGWGGGVGDVNVPCTSYMKVR